jgi:NAD-dependent dihydropyrimidine dehydrogenase PreA subunit
MAMFVRIDLTPEAQTDADLAKKLAEVCPVDIFEATDDGVKIVEENVDECVLCALCVEEAPPGGVRVVKLYSDEVLQKQK